MISIDSVWSPWLRGLTCTSADSEEDSPLECGVRQLGPEVINGSLELRRDPRLHHLRNGMV
jgi:hypothetical protein